MMRILAWLSLLALTLGSRSPNRTLKEAQSEVQRPRGHIFWKGRPVRGGFLGHAHENFQETAIPGTPLPGNPDVSISWFTQNLDHFDGFNTATWKQKYWVNKQFYRPGGPVFLMLGGEGPTSRHWIDINEGVPDYLKNAKMFGALAIQLEHRYYGESWPVADTTTPNLKWLSSRQSLADAANFVTQFPSMYGLPNATKWVTFGGSYSGALSAWMRLKYPHLVVGAIATSAPVQAQVDFKEYFGVVRASLQSYDPNCEAQVQSAINSIADALTTPAGRAMLAQKLQLCAAINMSNSLDVANFWESMADNFAGVVQYSQDNRGIYANDLTIPRVCQLMTSPAVPNVLDRFANVNALMLSSYSEPCLDYSYANLINYYKHSTFNSSNLSGRMWTWQTCTEFGYYQDSDGPGQPFRGFNLQFFLKQCADIYGPSLTPDVINRAIAQTNQYYGGRNLKATNVVLPNGSVDPWHALGILSSLGPTVQAVYIMGTAHCANMYPPRAIDPPELTYARNVVTNNLRQWLL